MECTFCKIISGELPSYTVYEDNLCKAFLPLKPIAKGHVILAAKEHIESYVDLSKETTRHMSIIARQVGRKMKVQFNPKKVGFAIVGFEIEHAHIHIVPMNKKYEITSSVYAHIQENMIAWSDEKMPVMTEKEQLSIQKQLL